MIGVFVTGVFACEYTSYKVHTCTRLCLFCVLALEGFWVSASLCKAGMGIYFGQEEKMRKSIALCFLYFDRELGCMYTRERVNALTRTPHIGN